MAMTNVSILSRFFIERINAVDGQTRPVLQRLKSICERRANGMISEQKALFEVDKILGRSTSPIIPNFIFGSQKSKPMNLFAGVKTNYKTSPLFDVQDFGLKNKKEQFPILGLKPLVSSSNKKRFVFAPMSRTWFDVKDFKQPVPVIGAFKNVESNSGGVLGNLAVNKQNKSLASQFKSDVFTHRINESNKAMKTMISTARQGMGATPVLAGFGSQGNPRQGKRRYPKRQQSVFEMMGVKK